MLEDLWDNISGSGSWVKIIKNTNSKIIGTYHVGGNIGLSASRVDNIVSQNNIIQATYDNAGGNVGYQSGWTNTKLTSTNNQITGRHDIGGNIGYIVGAATTNNLFSTNNSVKGTNFVGGNIGRNNKDTNIPNVLRVNGANTKINGAAYVGGSVGGSNGRIRNIKVQEAFVKGTGTYVGGIIGWMTYSSTSISATNEGYYSISNAYAKQVTVNGASNVGGIAGYELGTVSGAVAEECQITSAGDNVGGILGYYTGNSVKSSNFYLWHSFCTNSYVEGKNFVGGLCGQFVYGNIQYCYVANTSVKANQNGGGGLVGYFNNVNLSNLQYKATIKYNFIINESKRIEAKNSSGGMIGIINKKLNYSTDITQYNNIECNLIVTDIASTGIYVDLGIASINNVQYGVTQYEYMNNIYVYECSKVNNVQARGIVEENQAYKLVTSAQLRNSSIFVQNTQVKDSEGNVIGTDGLNFGNARYSYTNGYFPILKNNYSVVSTPWNASNLNVVQTKIQIPDRTVESTSPTVSLSTIEPMTLQGVSLGNGEIQNIPNVYLYAVDADKLNIEFSDTNSAMSFVITTKDDVVIVEKQPINNKVYTLRYDFKTPLEIKMYNSEFIDNIEINPNKVRNLLSIVNDEYLYLSNNSLNSNKRMFEGTFVNLYNGKALDASGNIYDISKMQYNGDIVGVIEKLEKEIPITESEYKGNIIQTFYHCTKVINNKDMYKEMYKDKQMFVKNDLLYLIDGGLKNIGNSIIIDSYNDIEYETILGIDGVIYNLLTEIKFPREFKNKDIIAMTNNLTTNSNVVLIYYSNGDVIGFNYITGEKVFDSRNSNQNTDLLEFMKDKINLNSTLYELKTEEYENAKELSKKLEKTSVEDALKQIEQEKINSKENTKQENIEQKNTEDVSNNYIENANTNNSKQGNNLNGQGNSSNEQINGLNEKEITNGNYENEYVVAFDAKNNGYAVYSTDELLFSETPTVKSENDKINNNESLNIYYNNVSTNKYETRNVGIIIIVVILTIITLILIIMYKRGTR